MKILLLLAASYLAHGAPGPWSPEPPRESAEGFVCGAPQALCGDHLPEGVTCDKGPGWCQPGYYCGYRLDRESRYTSNNTTESIRELKSPDRDQRCRPLGSCGQVGGQCCPSNADVHHTATTDKLARKPFCRDGNICQWNSSDAASTPIYAGVRGLYPCQRNPEGCGTSEGAACCPWNLPSKNEKVILTNPPTQVPRQQCPDKMFCHTAYWTPANETLQNTCFAREPKECGTFGKPCCRIGNPEPPPPSTGSPTGYQFKIWSCGPAAGSGGPYGFCDRTQGEPYGVCTACPGKGQKIDSKGFEMWGHYCNEKYD